MHMEESQSESAATCSGGTGTDDTTFIEVVEPSSFAAAGDRLLLHLNISYSTACPGDIQATTKSSNFLVEEQDRV